MFGQSWRCSPTIILIVFSFIDLVIYRRKVHLWTQHLLSARNLLIILSEYFVPHLIRLFK
jgi:hypothetical protein